MNDATIASGGRDDLSGGMIMGNEIKSVSLGVVIADDDPEVRKMLHKRLTREGFAVLGEASDGSEAIILTNHVQPDILILDEEMPSMSGADVAPFIRQGAPHTRIVAYSGSLRQAPDWADAYLSKTAQSMLTPLLAAMQIEAPARDDLPPPDERI